jgi:hypothetical protein
VQIKNLNHRGIRGHRVVFLSFSAIVSFFSKPSQKHSCFSEGLLKKEKSGGETAGYLSTGQILAEKDSLCSLCALCAYFLCGFETWCEEYSFRKPTDRRLLRIAKEEEL